MERWEEFERRPASDTRAGKRSETKTGQAQAWGHALPGSSGEERESAPRADGIEVAPRWKEYEREETHGHPAKGERVSELELMWAKDFPPAEAHARQNEQDRREPPD